MSLSANSALGGGALQALCLVIDELMCTQGLHQAAVLAAGRGHHEGAMELGNLHGQAANAAGRAMNQHALAGLDLPHRHDGLPGRDAR